MKWTLPSESIYKGNFDAAFFDASRYAGIGVGFRDFQGQIIAALSHKIPLVQSVELAEAMIAHRAMLFAKELSLFDVEIEGGLLKGSHCPEYAEEVWNFIWSCD